MKKLRLLLLLGFMQGMNAFSQLPSYVPIDGLVAYWPFSGNANDLSGNGNNGIVNGATLTTDRFGNPNCAYNFDGVNDYMNVIGNSSLNIYNNISIAGWIDLETTALEPYGIIDRGPGLWWHAGYYVRIYNQKVDFATSAPYTEHFSTSLIPHSKWMFFCCTYDNDSLKIYIDNNLSLSIGIGSGALDSWNTTSGLGIGMEGEAGHFFVGKLDDLGIWNRALTPLEITTLYASCIAGVTVYADADNDAYGNPSVSKTNPTCDLLSGYVLDNTDCNDANASIHPSAKEVCNGIDDNCNGMIDEISGLKTTNITATTATLNWKPLPGSKAYFIKYRLLDPSAKTLKTGVAAPLISATIPGLRPNSYYVWEIKSYCDGINTPYSGPVRFKTAGALSASEQEDESIKATGIGFLVYPNPGNGNMTVNLALPKPQSVSIRVSDVAGKEVYAHSEGMASGTFTRQLDLSKLSPGTYFLKLTHDGKSESKKIVVKK